MSLMVDTTPPEIFSGLSKDGSSAFSVAVPKIPVQVSDLGGVSSIELRLLEGKTEVSLVPNLTVERGMVLKQSTQLVEPIRDLIDGVEYTIWVKVSDRAGFTAKETFRFVVNLSLPDEELSLIHI